MLKQCLNAMVLYIGKDADNGVHIVRLQDIAT